MILELFEGGLGCTPRLSHFLFSFLYLLSLFLQSLEKNYIMRGARVKNPVNEHQKASNEFF